MLLRLLLLHLLLMRRLLHLHLHLHLHLRPPNLWSWCNRMRRLRLHVWLWYKHLRLLRPPDLVGECRAIRGHVRRRGHPRDHCEGRHPKLLPVDAAKASAKITELAERSVSAASAKHQ